MQLEDEITLCLSHSLRGPGDRCNGSVDRAASALTVAATFAGASEGRRQEEGGQDGRVNQCILTSSGLRQAWRRAGRRETHFRKENTKAEDRQDGGQHTRSQGNLWIQVRGGPEKVKGRPATRRRRDEPLTEGTEIKMEASRKKRGKRSGLCDEGGREEAGNEGRMERRTEE